MNNKPIIKGIRVDLMALKRIRHACRPRLCRDTHTCCTRYTPHVTQVELDRIVGYFPVIATYVPGIKDGRSFHNVFEEWDDGTFRIDAKDDESCVFAYTLSGGEMVCAIHTTALKLQIPPVELKPRPCSLWPLTLSDDNIPELSIDKNWHKFPCNAESGNVQHLDEGIADIIISVFGVSFLNALMETDQN